MRSPLLAIGLLASGGVISPADRSEPCINQVICVTMAGGFAGCQPRFYNQIKSLCHNVNKMGTFAIKAIVSTGGGYHVSRPAPLTRNKAVANPERTIAGTPYFSGYLRQNRFSDPAS
jgi:hypothetical protein